MGTLTISITTGTPQSGIAAGTLTHTETITDAGLVTHFGAWLMAYPQFSPLIPPAVTVTSASPGVVTRNAHGYVPGQSFQFGGTAVPGGTTVATNYYVLSSGLTANTFQFSDSPGGAAINTNSTGTAVVLLGVPLVQPPLTAANLNSAFQAWATGLISSTKSQVYVYEQGVAANSAAAAVTPPL